LQLVAYNECNDDTPRTCSTKVNWDECHRFFGDLPVKAFTHKVLLAAACRQYAPLKLTETLPAEF
jgi:hypothetical protein